MSYGKHSEWLRVRRILRWPVLWVPRAASSNTHTHLPPGNGEGQSRTRLRSSCRRKMKLGGHRSHYSRDWHQGGVWGRETQKKEAQKHRNTVAQRHRGSVLEPKTSGAAKKSKDRGVGTLMKLQTIDLKRRFDSSAMTVRGQGRGHHLVGGAWFDRQEPHGWMDAGWGKQPAGYSREGDQSESSISSMIGAPVISRS